MPPGGFGGTGRSLVIKRVMGSELLSSQAPWLLFICAGPGYKAAGGPFVLLYVPETDSSQIHNSDLSAGLQGRW